MTLKESSLREERLWPSAQKIKAGESSREAHAELVNTIKPVRPYDEPVPPASDKEVHDALSKDKKPSAFVPRSIPKGEPVAVRLDIPAYEQKNTWVVSVHHPKSDFTAGPVIGYDSVAHIDNPRFGVHPTGALNIASGKPKSTIATVHGNWRKTTPEKAYNLARTIHNNPEWRQVGMDPERHSYFYDRETQQPVISADEALHIGPLVYAKNPVYDKPENYKFSDGGDVEGYIPHDDKLRARNLKDFHGKTPKAIKEAKWFHGTNKDFSTFKSGESGAIFLTQSPSFAQDYTKQHMEHWHKSVEPEQKEYGGIFAEPATKPYKPDVHAPNIMPVHVRAEKPFDYENKKHIAALYETLGPDLIMDPYLLKFMDEVREGHWGALESPPIQNAIKDMGHDSFFVKEHGVKNLGVYDPSQIKSATGNQGTFDPSNPDITKRDGGDVEGYIPHDDPRRERNFREWFGKSTAVDGKSNPWVHYHLTKGNFSRFIPGGLDPKMSGPAIWLTPHKKDQPAGHNTIGRSGEFLEGANVMPLYVKINKPLFVDDSEPEEKEKLEKKFGSKSYAWPMSLHPEDIQKMKDAGYDGIYHIRDNDVSGRFNPDTGEGLETIVFHPSQLKSAIGNDGNFRPQEDDITKKRGGTVETKPVDVDHPNFRSWFGNSVAHDDGKPRRYFTGTSKDVDFPDFKVGRHGAWFTTNPKEASSYAEQNDSQGYKLDGHKVISTNTKSRVIPAYLKAENPFTGDRPDHLFESENYKKTQSDWFDTLRSQGYDSWVPDSQGGNLAVVLGHSGQIKSAISNTGDFDPDQKRIDRAGGGATDGDEDGITAYHGTPHDFDQFDTSKIGTGEGAQAFGHGLYFAENENIAKGYRDSLSADNPEPIEVDGERFHQPTRMQRLVANHFGDVDAVLKAMEPNWEYAKSVHFSMPDDADELERMLAEDNAIEAYKERFEVEGMRGKTVTYGKPGHMYEVHINAHPDHFLDWDKPLSEQSQHVKSALAKVGIIPNDEQVRAYSDAFKYAENNPNTKVQIPDKPHDPYGHEIYTTLRDELHLTRKPAKPFKQSEADMAKKLSKFGVRGIRYLDASSRGEGEGTRNYVVFDHNHVAVKRKYEQGGVVG